MQQSSWLRFTITESLFGSEQNVKLMCSAVYKWVQILVFVCCRCNQDYVKSSAAILMKLSRIVNYCHGKILALILFKMVK